MQLPFDAKRLGLLSLWVPLACTLLACQPTSATTDSLPAAGNQVLDGISVSTQSLQVEGNLLSAEELEGIAPADFGEPCSGIGSVCADSVEAVVRPCGGFSGTCDSTGTMDILLVNFICLPGGSGAICQAVASQVPETVTCTVPTDGNACSTGCGPSYCDYSSTCDRSAPRVRDCRSNGTCANDVCVGETVTKQNLGQTCSRITEGDPCNASCGAGQCHPNGTCSCGPPV